MCAFSHGGDQRWLRYSSIRWALRSK
jgi:hypothetical protein